ncbi:hypothetical protein Nmel_008932 [Mimus melanotis]
MTRELLYYTYKYAYIVQSILGVHYARSPGISNTRMCRPSSRPSSWHPLPSHRLVCEPPPEVRGTEGRDSATGLGGVQPVFGKDKTPPQHPPFIPGFLFAFVLTHKTKTPETAAASVRGRAVMTDERCAKVEQYVGEIKGGLRPAMKLTIIGMVHSKPKSFSVTLLCDPVDVNKDVGLLFTVNFSEKSITRNARIAGKWGREEKTIPYFPFTAGDTFKMELLCEHQQIRVLLDGRQLCDFTHRIQPLNLVKALRISGDIKLTKVA